jgi:hypothetical protein
MFDSRQTGPAVRAVVLVSGVAVAVVACATSGGEGGGPSPFTSTEPPATTSVASTDAASASMQSSTAMPDGCADAAEASRAAAGSSDIPEAASQSEPASAEEDASGEDAGNEDASGEDASVEDASGEDATDENGDDGGPPSTVVILPPLPAPGALVITEIMAQPSGPEPESEWFEIYNQSSSTVLLSGLTIQDGYLDTQVIPSNPVVVAPPGEYLVLVRSSPGAQAALVPSASIAYAYGTGVADDAGIELDAGPFGELTILNGSTVLTDVPYGQWGVSSPGQSLELGTAATTQSDPSGWCIAENPWAPGSDDGTPGGSSDCQ